MSRYKGRTDPKEIEKAFPHIIEIIVPLGGFGKKLEDMYEGTGRKILKQCAVTAGAIRMAARRSEPSSIRSVSFLTL
jgi:hypothetical protein